MLTPESDDVAKGVSDAAKARCQYCCEYRCRRCASNDRVQSPVLSQAEEPETEVVDLEPEVKPVVR